MKVGIVLACGKHLHHFIRKVWTHKTSLTPPLFIEVLVPSQESEQSCICVLRVSILHLSTIFIGFYNCSDSLAFKFFILLFQINKRNIIFIDSPSFE
jgi:hypothetical protein